MAFPSVAAARRRVVRRLEQAGAVSLEAAAPLDELNRIALIAVLVALFFVVELAGRP